MKKSIVFLGMWLLVFASMFILGINLDETILRPLGGGGMGYIMTIFLFSPWLPALIAAVPAFFLTQWLMKK